LREYAIECFGGEARAILSSWGVMRSEDFGEIVFILIDAGWLGKRLEDRKEDFQGGYDFAVAIG